MKKELTLYVWTEDILPNYTDGIAFALAENIEEARQMILDEYHFNYDNNGELKKALSNPPRIATKEKVAHYEYGGS